MKFSFIIPTLNEGEYLEECLKSIKSQNFNDYEIIIVDSYSKDNTVKIAKKYGAKVLYESKKGPAVARNTGAKKAKGEILIFPDADVRFEEDFLENLERKMKSVTAGGIFNIVPYDASSMTFKINYKIANIIASFFVSVGIPLTAGSCFSYRKEFFNRVGGFNPDFMTNEDHDLAKRISKFGRFEYFKDITVWTSTRRVKKWGTLKSIKIYSKSTFAFFLTGSYIRDYW